MQLRDAVFEDVKLIASMHAASWRSAYQGILAPDYLAEEIEDDRLQVWQGRFDAPAAYQKVMVAEESSTPVGFVCIFGNSDPLWGTLVDNLHVLPQTKGKGYGIGLLAAAAQWSLDNFPKTGLYLWCYAQNQPARLFYEKFGGIAVEEIAETTPDGRELQLVRYYWQEPNILIKR